MLQKQAVNDDGKVMSKDEIGYLQRELSLKKGVYFNDGKTFCKECVDEGRGKQLTEYSKETKQYRCTKCPAFVTVPERILAYA
jgi:hypothetical protein